MPGRYSLLLQRTASTTLSVGTLVASSGVQVRRFQVYDIAWSSEATPGDGVFLHRVARITAAGTSTAVTPVALDSADAAAVEVAGQANTVDATYTANSTLISVALNQRATWRWIAAPGGELVAPATNASGFGWATPTASSLVAVTATVMYQAC